MRAEDLLAELNNYKIFKVLTVWELILRELIIIQKNAIVEI